jgi:hypothetical protein
MMLFRKPHEVDGAERSPARTVTCPDIASKFGSPQTQDCGVPGFLPSFLRPIPLRAAPGYRVIGGGTRQEGRMREIS